MESSAQSRPGLDMELLHIVQDVEQLLTDLQIDLVAPEIVDGETAAKRYVLYLSILVNQLISDIVLSSIYSIDLMSIMKMRMLVEWTVKAEYFRVNPDYALAMTTVAETASVLRKVCDAKGPPDLILALTRLHEESKLRFPGAVNEPEKTMSQMMASVNDHPQERDDYVWLYGAPSALMHGDPEGMRFVDQGPPKIEEANAMLVDLCINSIHFCRQLRELFHPGVEDFEFREDTLRDLAKRKSLVHAAHRPEHAVDQTRLEIESLD